MKLHVRPELISGIVPYQTGPVTGIFPSQPESQPVPKSLIAQIPPRAMTKLRRSTTPVIVWVMSPCSKAWIYEVPKTLIVLGEI